MLNEDFSTWCVKLKQLSHLKRWRSLLVLVGDKAWTSQYVDVSLKTFLSDHRAKAMPNKNGLIYGNIDNKFLATELTAVNRKTFNQYLGTEQQLVVFSLAGQHKHAANNKDENDFDVDAFAALSGTLVSGGVLVLLISPNQLQHAQKSDYFLHRFMQQLAVEPSYVIKQADTLLPNLDALKATSALTTPSINELQVVEGNCISALPYGCITQEQVLAVDLMLKVLSGHRDRPLVLTADRGRGKSTALALAACQMLESATQPLKILISAPSKQALAVFFQQIAQHLPGAEINGTSVEHINGSINFYPIDALLKEQPVASIVMVDEAAAIPVYLLQQLLGTYHRLVFASTIHGYEGAGRGFSIKFRQVLQRLMPNWRNMHIKEAIRWASDDPLEQFVFNSCLLNAQLPNFDKACQIKVNTNITVNSALQVELISVAALLEDEALLQAVFSVLVTAHYQTSPSDLKLLLNNRAISLCVLKCENILVGVAMLMREGLVDEDLVEKVLENKRRLRDQFLPQSLMMHCGVKTSFNYSYQRVMRIAIHPEIQGQGLGQYFLKCIEQQSVMQNIDFIGASFAGNSELVKFWQQAGFSLARVGFSKDKASGEHSCLVTKALTPSAKNLQHAFTEQFYLQLSYWLTDEFKDMPAKLVWQLLNGNTELKRLEFPPELAETLNDFACGQRQFSSCIYALQRWLISHLTEDFDAGVLPLIARILQKHSIEQVCKQYSFTGKKSLNQHLIHYIRLHNFK
jgi:tRNA(Met) cytidine acetyltransferase